MRKTRIFLSVLLVLSLLVSGLGVSVFSGAVVPIPAAGAATDDGFIISEYLEGSSYNKAIELYNGSGAAIDLSQYKVCLYANGAGSPANPNPTGTLLLTGTLAAGGTYVIAHATANAVILGIANVLSSAVMNFNGDDAVSLDRVADSSHVDVVGQIGVDPGTYWGTIPVTTMDYTLVRKPSVVNGDPIGTDVFDPAVQWDAYAKDDFSHLGTHTMGTGTSVPGSPTGLAATDGLGQISLAWLAPANDGGAGTVGYNVYRAADASMSGMTILNGSLVTTTSYVNDGLGAGAHYWYTVTAHNSIGDGAASSAVEGWTFDTPNAVTTLAAVEGDHQVDLTWSASVGDPQHLSVVSYNVWRGTSAGGEDIVTPINGTPITGLSFSDTTVVNGTPYFYRITAVNEVGQTSVPSGNEVHATPHILNTAPIITNLVPADQALIANVRPHISAEYGDTGSAINVTSVKLLVDGIDVTAQAVVTASSVNYAPVIDLTKSLHSVQLDVANLAATPVSTQAVWTFTVGNYNIYFGGMHSHTNL